MMSLTLLSLETIHNAEQGKEGKLNVLYIDSGKREFQVKYILSEKVHLK